ncbi:MAG: hypothetical protein KF823_05850 [Xanthomonadales bacterium]|nr:hypothetical protein [Xanthomonadales bacterium]
MTAASRLFSNSLLAAPACVRAIARERASMLALVAASALAGPGQRRRPTRRTGSRPPPPRVAIV